MKRLLAEAIGTFALVLFGTGAIVVDAATGGALGHVGISIVFGLVVMTMIQTLGDVSGAHLNPAVTLGFWAARRFPLRDVAPYAGAQCGGAILASTLLRVLFPEADGLGATTPSGGLAASFALEVVLTFFLMFVILGVTSGAEEKGLYAGIAIGATVALGALFGGPVSGGSMNPARSLGPALVSGHFSVLWLYLLAPAFGALLAVPGCRGVRQAGCCSADGATA